MNIPWTEYPRPQMKRTSFQSLNGIWKLNQKDVLVPYPPESILSNYNEKVAEELVYERDFVLSDELIDKIEEKRILLHFGAIDQVAKVYVNDEYICEHEGGYLPFYADVTDAIFKRIRTKASCNTQSNETEIINDTDEITHQIRVEVIDTLSHDYPYGKQTKKRGGMWYTPVSGIWQSVWLEAVPINYIEKVTFTPDFEGVDVELDIHTSDNDKIQIANDSNRTKEPIIHSNSFDGHIDLESNSSYSELYFSVEVELPSGKKLQETIYRNEVTESSNRNYLSGRIMIPEEERKLWSPEEPYLYRVVVRFMDDVVESYFALRTITIVHDYPLSISTNDANNDSAGKTVPRVLLNGEPVFLHGVLDQGYFMDGIYLPKEPSEYEKDVLRMKELGMNFIRKHIKVEPEAFYYACDKLGMLVMQDMVNSGPYSFFWDTALPTIGFKKRPDSLKQISGKRKSFFIKHSIDTQMHLYNHPCVIAYTIFNEGWGQFQSDKIYQMLKNIDPTRLYDSTSGWFAQKENDFDSEHIYFKVKPLHVKMRPLFLSECGGYTLAIEGHMFDPNRTYGYGACKDSEELTNRICHMYEQMVLPFIRDGVCGCVYTQLSDVEDEINGLYTYDRAICKVKKEMMLQIAKQIEECL